MPGLTAQGRKWRTARQAMEIALQKNITPAEAKRELRRRRRDSRILRQAQDERSEPTGAIDQCGTRFDDFDAPWMLRD